MSAISAVRLVAAATCAAAVSAQTAFVLTRDPTSASGGPLAAYGTLLPSMAAPSGLSLVSPFARPAMPNYWAASIAATGAPTPPVAHEGGMAIDQNLGIVYATDGLTFLTQDAHSVYGGASTAPTATLPLAGWPGGPLTGIAIATAGLLFVCDSTSFQARSKTYPYAAAGPAMPLPPFLGTPGATGLDFDAETGTLWACNVAGATINFSLAGAPIAAFPAPPVAGIAPVRGIAVNTTAGPSALPPLPGQTPGFHICLTNGDRLYDALPPFASIDVASSHVSHCRGLVITSDPVVFQGRFDGSALRHKIDPALNPGPGFAYPQIGMTTPACKFLSGPTYLYLDGAPAGSPATLLVDLSLLAPASGGLVIDDDVLWLSPFSPSYFTAGVTADASGHAQLEVPLAVLPVGLQVATQWILPDGGGLLGVDFSDALVFRVGLP